MAFELVDDTPAPAASAAGRFELVDEPAPKAEGKGSARLKLAGVPLIGPALAAADIDPASLGRGMLSGAADIGNTIINAGVAGGTALLNPKAALLGTQPRNAVQQWNDARNASLKDFNDADQSGSAMLGRVGANIAGTAGMGGALAAPVRMAAPLVGRFAPAANMLAESIATGGARTGATPGTLLQSTGNMGARILGGGINGAGSGALVNPEDAGTGALIGAAAPPVLAGAGRLGSAGANLVRAAIRPEAAKSAEAILRAGNLTNPEDVAAVRAALNSGGPNLVGSGPTVPQILQNPGVSQLQRTLRNAGETSLLNAEAEQNAARFAALDRVSPVTGTRNQAAENFGNALAPEVIAADRAAKKRVGAAFEGVDPFGESRLELPIDQMAAARDKFLGRATFGQGGDAAAAVRAAQDIGTETLSAVPAARAAPVQPQNTLVQAVRRAGGINVSTPSGRQLAGELGDLRQSQGMSGVVFNSRGESVDKLAQRMHAEGRIPDDDPATLLNHLRDPDLAKTSAPGADMDRLHQAAREALQGDAPGALTISKPVGFQEVQDLRSSIGDAARKAELAGNNREAAALKAMTSEIDNRVTQAAQGELGAGEFFPPDMVAQWRKARDMHADRLATFRTGPQASIFRQGGDGLPQAQGAELAPKFFSSRPSQAADIDAFGRVASPNTTNLLKNFAVTDLAGQQTAGGVLSQAKVGNWLDSRSGAVTGLFNPSERATLTGVRTDLDRAAANANLGRAVGSNTAQNVEAALGSGLDNPIANLVASRIPIIGRFTGPMLQSLQQTAKRGKVEKLSGLLADPRAFDEAVAAYQKAGTGRGLPLLERTLNDPMLYRSAPLLGSSR